MDSRPFGGLISIFVGNSLQMPQMKERVLVLVGGGIDDAGRLRMLPDDPDYPWNSKVFADSRLRILKVRIVGANHRAMNDSVVDFWNRAVRGALQEDDIMFLEKQRRYLPQGPTDAYGHVSATQTLILTPSKALCSRMHHDVYHKCSTLFQGIRADPVFPDGFLFKADDRWDPRLLNKEDRSYLEEAAQPMWSEFMAKCGDVVIALGNQSGRSAMCTGQSGVIVGFEVALEEAE